MPSSQFLSLCRKSVEEALRLLLSGEKLSISKLVDRLKFNRKSAWYTLTCLKKAEFVVPHGWGQYGPNDFVIRGESILLNPRDAMLDLIFKRAHLRRVLKAAMIAPQVKKSEIARTINISLRTVLRTIRDLQRIGILSKQRELRFLYEPKDQVERLPRAIHRRVFGHLLKCLEAYGASGIPSAIIAFGPVAEGLPLQPIGAACLTSLVQRPEDHLRLAFALAHAKDNVESNFKLNIEPVIVIENAYLAAELNILAQPNYLLKQLVEGVCIFGRTPRKEDYFEILNRVTPLTTEEIKEKIEKGYIMPVGNHYVFTEKAIETFRRRAPTHILETCIPVDNERKIGFVTIGKTTPFL